MKDKYKNIEKIIFLLMGIALLIILTVLTQQTTENKNFYKKKIAVIKAEENKNIDFEQNPNLVLNEQQEKLKSNIMWRTKRNIFIRWKSKKIKEIPVAASPILEILEIGYKPLGIEYQGRIVFHEGKLVGQINLSNKSYIVESGTRLPGYTIEVLNRDYIELKDAKGSYKKIKYRQMAYTNELVAKLKEHTSGYIKDVSKNSQFLRYKVLDIDEESVLLSKQGQHLRLKKGMVHK